LSNYWKPESGNIKFEMFSISLLKQIITLKGRVRFFVGKKVEESFD
jgi:hypothetical protein